MTIAITSSGIALDGPLVAGEKVAVTVSGLALAAEDKPTLALLARFPDALLASVELAEDADTPGTWTGELDTATKQTAFFFATARADERRDVVLELVAGRVSLARLTVPMTNSALCPKLNGLPFASPVYIPVPGPPGTGGDPYEQNPEMDGEASPGTSDEYARGDHRHPTDTSRQAVIEDLASIRSGAAAGATAVQPSALSAYRTATAQDAVDGAQDAAISAKYTKPASGIPASDLASGVLPTALPNPEPLHIGAVDYNGSTEEYVPSATTSGDYGIVTLESATNSTNEAGHAATPLAVKTVADSVAAKATATSIAPAFSSSSTYAVGAYCTHEGLLYKCTTAVTTAGAWNAANWTAVSAMGEMPAPQVQSNWSQTSSTAKDYIKNKPDLSHVVYYQNDGSGGNTNLALTVGARTGDIRGQPSLAVGNDVRADGVNSLAQGYNVKATDADAHAEGNGTTASGRIAHAEGNGTTASGTSAHAEGNGTTASGNTAHAEGYMTTAAGNISHAEGISTYAAGRPSHAEGNETTAAGIASHADGYRAVTAASGNGSAASTPHDYAFAWQGVSTGGYYRSHGAGTFNINPVPASGSTDPATGFWIGESKLSDYLRYSFASPTPTVSGTSATVACEDRAINDFTVATGITSLTITPPAAVTGRARDFFCRVTITDSSLPTVTLSGGTIDIGATEVAGMTQGVNLLMFTEIASGHWLASRRSAS